MVQDYMKYEICKPRDPRFIQMLIEEYNTTNISLHDLSKKYHTDASYQFKIHNVPKRSKGVQRSLSRTGCVKYKWDGKTITTQEEAYIYGLLYADGYINDTQMGIRLKESDKSLIEKVKNYFSDEIRLQKEERNYSFVLSSKVVCENFIGNGLIKRRTGTELVIPSMDKSLLRHFIRGYFDGDGSVYKCNRNNYAHMKANICCVTISILEQFKAIFTENNIVGTINKESRKGKLVKTPGGKAICKYDMYRLFIRQKCSIKNLYHFLYDNATIYIERKKKVFDTNIQLLNYEKNRKPIPS